MEYSIGKFAEVTGLSPHTLRYYEKEGLISVKRGRGGQRYYSEADLKWVDFIKRLKDTGMPIKEIKVYAAYRAEGEGSLNQRMAMLESHRKHILAELAKWREHLKCMDRKVEYYQGEIERMEK